MVKRPKSPDIPDDAKYLVVHQPYPLNANFELPGDYIAFAFWIASILESPVPILGIHHKPKARSMVILEVDRKTEMQRLLGEHRWKEVLKDPRVEEEEWISQVFYCLHKTTREAQKDGWKRIHVENDWFVDRGWNLETGPFKYPYPETHWCPPLPEDPTYKNIARPLPVKVKPPPPTSPALVPGSEEWVSAVALGKPTRQEQSGAWATKGSGKRGRGRGSRGAGPSGGSARGRPSPRVSVSTATHQAVTNLASSIATSNPWVKMASSGAASPAPSFPNSASSSGGYYPPPGLGRMATSNSSSAGPSTPLVPPGLTQSSMMSIAASDSEEDEDKEPVFVPFGENEESDEDEFEGYQAPYEATTAQQQKFDVGVVDAEAEPVNLWAAYAPKKNEEEVPMCSVHGKLCKKGICAERKKMDREAKKAKEAEERAAAKKSKKKGKKKDSEEEEVVVVEKLDPVERSEGESQTTSQAPKPAKSRNRRKHKTAASETS